MAGVAHKHPQAAYVGLQKSLQQEWAFVQRATKGLGEDFQPVEKALWEGFLPDLFHGATEHMPDWTITGLPVKHAGLAIPDPAHMAKGNWTASCVVTGHLVAALRGRVEFRSGDHTQLLTDDRKEIRRQKDQEVEEAFSAAAGRLSPT